MSKFDWAKVTMPSGSGGDDDGGRKTGRAPMPSRGGPFALPSILALILAAAIVYGGYFWCFRRVVVGPGKVLVLLKKDGSRSLPGGQIIVPRAPDAKTDPEAYKQWQKKYGDVNGIMEQVYPEGTYFGFSPFDFERDVVDAAIVPNGKVGVVVKRFGEDLDP